jgi:formate C-acetyltransferase
MRKVKSDLREKLTVKAVRNVQRGYTAEDKAQGLFRPEIKLDLQRSRLITEAMKNNEGKPIIIQQAQALAHVLTNMDLSFHDT